MWRRAAAGCLVAAPILLAVATGVDPALGDDQGYGVYRAHPTAVQWHSLLLHWAWVLFVPGLLGLLAGVRRRGAALARVAWVAVVVGLTTFSALMAFDFFLLALEQTLPDAQVEAVDTRFQGLTWTVAGWQWPGLLGWGLALLLAPLAAARAGVIRWWAAATALAGTALYFVFAISPVPLCLIGPAVMAVGYTAAARQLVRGGAGAAGAAAEPDSYGRFRRRAARVCMVAAPLSFAAGMATVPDVTGDVADSVAHPVQTQISAFLLHLGWVLFVPAVLGLAARGRRFTMVAGGVTAVALINFSALMVGDSADLAARQVLDPATADRVSEAFGGLPFFSLGWALPGMALSLLGLIAVTAGAAADRVVRWWVPALTVAGLAAFLLLGLGLIGVTGPLLLLAAFATAARTVPDPASAAEAPREPVPAHDPRTV
ncbi:hypothetical protein [Spirilliplanes yamanashiensis]|uniref:Uncharacterized protein n=1 Tax=Spirilliplanes yamanashiensis TaxID=42233 RepID=A0A8J4DKY8_9ACTN|nr:hypothetical protein [Spirilliplanes yamanashiensis]MDP9818986.1 hypothetical protein [Spirilliplanes yamanashiensis]GIJ05441.1 hypothetical protein Sya03_47930 [Spirilliplanes yamanashiensis]